MLKSVLCGYSDAYIHVKRTIAIPNTVTTAAPGNRNKKVTFKNCAPFIDCMTEINNIQLDNAKDIDIVVPMYNLIEYSDIHSKVSRSL